MMLDYSLQASCQGGGDMSCKPQDEKRGLHKKVKRIRASNLGSDNIPAEVIVELVTMRVLLKGLIEVQLS